MLQYKLLSELTFKNFYLPPRSCRSVQRYLSPRVVAGMSWGVLTKGGWELQVAGRYGYYKNKVSAVITFGRGKCGRSGGWSERLLEDVFIYTFI